MSSKKMFIDTIKKLSEHDIILPVLADVIEGQILNGGIEFTGSVFSGNATHGVVYNRGKNKLYVNGARLADMLVSSHFRNMWNTLLLKNDKKKVKNLIKKSDFGEILATMLYFAMHIYSRYNRGVFLKDEATRRWYTEYFYRCIYDTTDQLTKVSRKAASLWAYPYMEMALEYFEIPTNHGKVYDNSDLKKINYMLYKYHKNEIMYRLERSQIDQPAIDAYEDWFKGFQQELTYCFLNQRHRLIITQKYVEDDEEYKILTWDALNRAYERINSVNVVDKRIASPYMRELFITAEPLAQSIYATSLECKLQGYEEWQKMCARGISLLS